MRSRLAGVLVVLIVAVGIIGYKQHRTHASSGQLARDLSLDKPQIVLVVDPREADSEGDNCAEIIRLVRNAGGRGIKVQEFSPGSDSPVLKQYHVLMVPTVLILDRDGKIASRYEGEDGTTLQRIRDRLATLSEVQH